MTSVDDLVGNSRLYRYALTAAREVRSSPMTLLREITAALTDSGALAGLDVVDRPCFAGDEQIARMVATGPRERSRARLVDYLLQRVVIRRRQLADLFGRTA